MGLTGAAAAAPATVTSAGVGSTCGGYQLLRRVGQGGMAEVFLATSEHETGVRHTVAIKRLLPTFVDRPGYIDMFLDEARVSASLSHPNIAEIIDVGLDGKVPYIAMEYLDGEDVRTIAQALLARGRRMPLACALHVVMAVAAGLHHAHEQRGSDGAPLEIVHRDVTPHNLLVTFDGAVKLLDFGIARSTNRSSRTRAGTIKGKISYLSPEQCRSEPLDRRTDLFSLGIVMWELTLGRRLYTGPSDWAVVRRILDQPIPAPRMIEPDYPKELDQIVMSALAKDRERRCPTARHLLAQLGALAHAKGWLMSSSEVADFMLDLFGADRARRGIRALSCDEPTPAWDRAPPEVSPTDAKARSQAETPAQVPRTHRPPRAQRIGRWYHAVLLAASLLLLLLGLAGSRRGRVDRGQAPVADVVVAPPPPAEPAPPSPPLLVVDPGLAQLGTSDLGGRLTTKLRVSPAAQVTRTDVSHDRGLLRLATSPWCDVTVDGRPVGRTPLVLPVTVGEHVVELSSPELPTNRMLRVNVHAGETIVKQLAFRR